MITLETDVSARIACAAIRRRAMVTAACLGLVTAACRPADEARIIPTPTRLASPPAAGFAPGGGALSCRDPFGGEDVAFPLAGWPETDFCRHSVDFAEIVSGGQPRDGIPPIDDPVYETVDSASAGIENSWPLLVIVGSNQVLAFPLPILLWHEVVNTEIDGGPLAITYSPMSGSGRAFWGRDPSGESLDFGTTGNLRFGNSVLYDRPTRSWWQQLSGEAIVGERTETSLTALPSQVLAWPEFVAAYPEGQVLSRETGAVRDYGYSPYAGMETSGDLPALVGAFVAEEVDDRLSPMERITSLAVDGGPVAYAFEALSKLRVVNDEVDGQAVAIFWQPGARSLTDAARVGDSRDVGSSGVYSRDLAGQTLMFEWTEDGIRDRETGSSWSLTGRAVAGPLRGEQLTRLASVEAFWFAWSAIFPETEIWDPQG